MKDKKRNCLVFLVLFICLTVCAQSSDEVKAMRNLRDYYTQNICLLYTSPSPRDS